ncbi:hypothetical protein HY493_03235 [Candidatus Woesearchaeota archaeon]|nr:hypothetical protein [Candidatus Woesearchaeota archaeon]
MLYLIGTQHNDLKLEQRLETALDALKPDVILVEGDAKRIAIQARKRRALLREFTGRLLRKGYAKREIPGIFRTFGYRQAVEPRVAFAYAERNRVSAYHLEKSPNPRALAEQTIAFERQRIIDVPPRALAAVLRPEFFASEAEFQRTVDRGYIDFAREYASKRSKARVALLDAHAPTIVGERDRLMERTVRDKIRGTTVAIAGAIHLYQDEQGRTLYERVKDLRPLRTLASDFSQGINRATAST